MQILVYTFIDGENNNSLLPETNGTIRTAKIFDYESDDAMFALHVNGTDGEGRSATGLIIVELIDDALEKTVISFKGLVTDSSELVLRLKIDQEVKLLMRALGPSLGTGFVSDPTMSLKDDENNSLSENDDWQSGSQAASISETGLSPTHGSGYESAIIHSFQEGNYSLYYGGYGEEGFVLADFIPLDSDSLAGVAEVGFMNGAGQYQN